MIRIIANIALALTALTAWSETSAGNPQGDVTLHGNFTFSGTFEPTPVDTNKDGLVAERTAATVDGRLTGIGAASLQGTELASLTTISEYGLLNPETDTFTSCFRVSEDDFSVQENAYFGPIAHLIRPIRDPVVNPSSSSYGAEEWTAFYRLATGELLYAQVTGLEICVENVHPIPICHVRSTEQIIGGTGRFKHATGEVFFTAIAPTFTADAALLTESGSIDLSRKQPTFSFGPIHGAGQMSVHVPPPD